MSFDNVEVGQVPDGNSAPIGITSFDEVSDIVESVEAAEKAEKAEANKEASKVAEKVADKVAKKLSEDGKEPEKADTEELPATDASGAPVPKAKPIVAYDADGKPLDLNPDLEIEFKVDGKAEKMKLSEVRNQISGKVNWDRKNNEFFKTKKTFDDQVKFVNEQVDNILKMAQEKPEAALFELARLAGKSPEEYSKMLAGTIEGANRWSDMSDLERKAAMVEAENTAYRSDAQRRKEIEERSKAEGQRVDSINLLAKELELSDDDINGLADDLQKHAQISQPTSEHIYTAWVYKNTADIFQSVAPEALRANPSLFNEAAQVFLSNGIRDKATIEEIIKQAYSEDEPARKVGRKIASQAPKTASAATQSKKQEIVSFDDI